MVCLQVTRIPEDLVHKGLGKVKVAFYLKDHQASAFEHDYIRSPQIARELVLQQGNIFSRGGISSRQLHAFLLQPRNASIPSADLLLRCIGYKASKALADSFRWSRRKRLQ